MFQHSRFILRLFVAAAIGFAAIPGTHATIVDGRVTDAGGAGIAAVDLDFIDRDTGASIPLLSDNTDILGFYAVTVPEGRYDIRFEPLPGARFVGAEIRGVDVEGTSITLNQVLSTGFFVTGRATYNGAGILGLDIDVLQNGAALYVAHDQTAGIGDFKIVLPGGTYQIQFEPPAGSFLVPTQLNRVVVNGDTALGDIPLPAGVHLTGRTVDGGGANVGEVLVQTLNPANGAESCSAAQHSRWA